MNSNYIAFDRIMFTLPLDKITVINTERFTCKMTGLKTILSHEYNSQNYIDSTYLLWIRLDYTKGKAIINVSSKCLMDKYPESINKNNITSIFDIINNYNMIYIDSNKISQYAKVVSCDVVHDVTEKLSLDKIDAIKSAVYNSNWRTYTYDSGITFAKVTKRGVPTGVSLTAYDKEYEIQTKNQLFLSKLINKEAILNSFKNKVRYELKLNKSIAIKRILKIRNNDLLTVLNCNNNPINDLYSKIVDVELSNKNENYYSELLSYNQIGKAAFNHYRNVLLVKECNYNYDKVKATVRRLISVKTNLTSTMKPFKKIIQDYSNSIKHNEKMII